MRAKACKRTQINCGDLRVVLFLRSCLPKLQKYFSLHGEYA